MAIGSHSIINFGLFESNYTEVATFAALPSAAPSCGGAVSGAAACAGSAGAADAGGAGGATEASDDASVALAPELTSTGFGAAPGSIAC